MDNVKIFDYDMSSPEEDLEKYLGQEFVAWEVIPLGDGPSSLPSKIPSFKWRPMWGNLPTGVQNTWFGIKPKCCAYEGCTTDSNELQHVALVRNTSIFRFLKPFHKLRCCSVEEHWLLVSATKGVIAVGNRSD